MGEKVREFLGYMPKATPDDVQDALKEILEAWENGEISDAFFSDACDYVSGLTD